MSFSWYQQIFLSTTEFAFKTHVQSLLGLLIPAKVIQLIGTEQKGFYLGMCLFGGAGMACLLGPIIGVLSDHTRSEFGRRRIWIFLGVILDCLFLGLMAFSTHISVFIMAYICVATSVTAAASPFAGLIADVVPPEKTTSTAGVVASFGFLGTLMGGIIGILTSLSGDLSIGFAILMIFMMCGMIITVLFVKEISSTKSHESIDWKRFFTGFVTPFLYYADYRWSIITQVIFQLGIETLRNFMQYWLKDNFVFPLAIVERFQIRDEIAATSILMTLMAIFSLPSSFLVGKLTEYYSLRAIFVSISSIFLFGLPLMMVLTKNVVIVILFAVLFGIGQGMYISLGWSIAIDTLPTGEHKTNAQSLGLWQSARIIATVFSGTVSGIVLDNFQRIGKANGIPNLGYTVIFSFASICFLIGGVTIWKVETARRLK